MNHTDGHRENRQKHHQLAISNFMMVEEIERAREDEERSKTSS